MADTGGEGPVQRVSRSERHGRATDRDQAWRGNGGASADRAVAEAAENRATRSEGAAARAGSPDGHARAAPRAARLSSGTGLRVGRCTSDDRGRTGERMTEASAPPLVRNPDQVNAMTDFRQM